MAEKKMTRPVSVKLSDAQCLEVGKEQAKVDIEIARLEAEAKAKAEAAKEVAKDFKERIDKLIGEGSPFDRLERLQTAIALLPSATQPPTRVGTPAGVRPTGSTTGNPDTRKPQEISWKDALKK